VNESFLYDRNEFLSARRIYNQILKEGYGFGEST